MRVGNSWDTHMCVQRYYTSSSTVCECTISQTESRRILKTKAGRGGSMLNITGRNNLPICTTFDNMSLHPHVLQFIVLNNVKGIFSSVITLLTPMFQHTMVPLSRS